MRIGPVAEAEFAPLVRDIAGEDVDTAERFARAAWSSIAEPGDGDAGVLVASLGAQAALQVVLEGAGAGEIVARVAEAGVESDPARWTEALKRWAPRADLAATLRALRQTPQLAWFLAASAIYRDGVTTILAMGGLYAGGTFGMDLNQLIMFGMSLNVTAGLGAAVFAWLDDAIGSKRTIMLSVTG